MGPEIIAALAAQATGAASTEAWESLRRIIKTRTSEESSPEADEAEEHRDGASQLPAAQAAAAVNPLAGVLEGYYKKVGVRADVSFFAAIAAAVLGYLAIAAGITIGVLRSDDLILGVVATGAGVFSQVLSFFFFRNRAEERKMMIEALASLREDAEKSVRAARAQELIEQVRQPLLRDNLTAAVALELSSATISLTDIHDAISLFRGLGERSPAVQAQQQGISQGSAPEPGA
jgi:hypothetical protein